MTVAAQRNLTTIDVEHRAPVDGHTAARLLGVTLPRVQRLEPLSVAATSTRPDSLAGLARSIA